MTQTQKTKYVAMQSYLKVFWKTLKQFFKKEKESAILWYLSFGSWIGIFRSI